ncbi:MAG: DUF5658 family protein [Dehalococcoidia bacterium]|nr:DUF5658 family protein [Dehalococcoidia bacterium]
MVDSRAACYCNVTMELRNKNAAQSFITQLKLSDPKTDIFLAANALDAALTYMALQYDGLFMEFNSILYGAMNTIGIGATLLLKMCLSIFILWILRKSKRENLLVPLSILFAVTAMANLMVMRAFGVQV